PGTATLPSSCGSAERAIHHAHAAAPAIASRRRRTMTETTRDSPPLERISGVLAIVDIVHDCSVAPASRPPVREFFAALPRPFAILTFAPTGWRNSIPPSIMFPTQDPESFCDCPHAAKAHRRSAQYLA